MMSKFQKFFCIVILLAGIVTSAPAQALEDAIIAVVNDDIVTLKDLQDYVRSLYTQLKLEGKSEWEIRQAMKELENNGISKLIEDKLVLTEANRMGMEIRDQVVEQRLNEIKQSYQNEQDFLKAVLNQGATITDLKKKLRDYFKIKYMIEQEVKAKIYINPKEVTDYYKSNFEKFKKPERLELESIFIAETKDGPNASERAAAVLSELLAGADFPAMATTHSQGRGIRLIERGQMLPEIESKLFALKEGELSEVISADGGCYIFKITKKFPEEISSLDLEKDKITKVLYQDKFREQYKKWIDTLKSAAFIDIKG